MKYSGVPPEISPRQPVFRPDKPFPLPANTSRPALQSSQSAADRSGPSGSASAPQIPHHACRSRRETGQSHAFLKKTSFREKKVAEMNQLWSLSIFEFVLCSKGNLIATPNDAARPAPRPAAMIPPPAPVITMKPGLVLSCLVQVTCCSSIQFVFQSYRHNHPGSGGPAPRCRPPPPGRRPASGRRRPPRRLLTPMPLELHPA